MTSFNCELEGETRKWSGGLRRDSMSDLLLMPEAPPPLPRLLVGGALEAMPARR